MQKFNFNQLQITKLKKITYLDLSTPTSLKVVLVKKYDSIFK